MSVRKIANVVAGVVLAASVFAAYSAHAGPVDDLQPGEWYEIPNSKMRQVAMSPDSHDAGAVMWAWSGGAYDSTRDRLIVWGGGHNDYAGNELYAFDLGQERWIRLTDPSPVSGVSGSGSTMPDGRPRSVHTYDHVQFDPVSGKFFAASGSTYPTGAVSSATWLFNFDTAEWERQQNVPGDVYDLLHLSMASDYDPVSKRIAMLGPRTTGDFDPATGRWTKHGSADFPWLPLGLTAAVDPVRRKFVAIGRGASYILDIDTQGRLSNLRELNSGGATEIENYDAPGLVFDPRVQKLVGWGAGSTVYSLDLDSRTWSAHQASNSVSPGNPYSSSNYNGTFGRFRYVPSKDLYIVVTSVDENVFVHRLSDTVEGAPITTTPNAPDEMQVIISN